MYECYAQTYARNMTMKVKEERASDSEREHRHENEKRERKKRTRNEFEAIECIFAYTSTSLNRSIYRIQRSCSTYNTVHVVYAIRDMLLLETNTFIFPTTFHFQTDCRFRY